MRIIKTLIVSLLTIGLIFTNTVVTAQYLSNDKQIIIDIPSRKLFLIRNDEIVKEYPVAVGKAHSQTPVGKYKVINKVVDPYYAKLNIAGGSPYNPLGSRWIGFKPHYGIHGNSNPASIGTFASAGCVRMFERDVQEIYSIVNYNVPVTVQYQLVKVLRDVDNENPILMVYPDYYSFESDLSSKIDSKLKEIGLYESIPKESLESLKTKAKKEITYISNGYAYFINNTYITNDVIKSNEEYYINKDKFEGYFNINMFSIDEEEYCAFHEDRIHKISKNEKEYIAINDLERIFGGTHVFDNIDWSLNYNLDNYILLNGSLIRGLGSDLTGYPIVPLYDLTEALNIDIKISRDKSKFIYEGQELEELYFNDEPYISLEALVKTFHVKTNIHTSKKFIELYTEPAIIYNDVIFKGIREDNEILVPFSIFATDFLNNKEEINREHISAIGSLKILRRSSKTYVRLSELLEIPGYEIQQRDFYRTKIHLEKRDF